MSINFKTKGTEGFIAAGELEKMEPMVQLANKMLNEKSGAGNDFLGWVDLPFDYDKEEFARIKAAAKKIQSNSEVLIVIGIGGSYLGGRAALEFINGSNYNLKKTSKYGKSGLER